MAATRSGQEGFGVRGLLSQPGIQDHPCASVRHKWQCFLGLPRSFSC
jgi:hypothetical protein